MSIELVVIICLFIILLSVQRLIYSKKLNLEKRKYETKPDVVSQSDKEVHLENEIEKLRVIIEDTKAIAQDASMIKTEFLTNIRHEVRTPMNAILVFSGMIEKESRDATLKSYAKSIFNSGENLLQLLNNIIEMSEIDAGKIDVSPNATDVNSFIDRIVEVHKHKAIQKGLSFNTRLDSSMAESIMIDDKRVKKILDDLFDNALKFTKNGEINFNVTMESFDEVTYKAKILFQVQDTGLGILKENQEKIFQMFDNKGISHKPEHQGTGLSLSIDKKLATLMNGSLKVYSELQEGATFSLTLDDVEVILANSVKDVDVASIDFSVLKADAKIMVIDYTKETLDLVQKCFNSTQVKIFTSTSARESLALLHNESMDVILINVDILSMDDNAVAKVIKSLSRAFVISLVDGNSLAGVSFHKDGVKPMAHLSKPLNKLELFRTLLKILNSQECIVKDGLIHKKLDDGLSFMTDEEGSREYFKHAEDIDKQLLQALETNDLNVMMGLAKGMYQLSLAHKQESLGHFSKKLVTKIEAFEVDGINAMLREYQRKVKEFRDR